MHLLRVTVRPRGLAHRKTWELLKAARGAVMCPLPPPPRQLESKIQQVGSEVFGHLCYENVPWASLVRRAGVRCVASWCSCAASRTGCDPLETLSLRNAAGWGVLEGPQERGGPLSLNWDPGEGFSLFQKPRSPFHPCRACSGRPSRSASR